MNPGVVVGLLLGAAMLARRPPEDSAAQRAAPRGWRRRVSRSRPGPDDDLLDGARLAERAAALLRAGVTPATAWQHAAPGNVTGEGPPVTAPASVVAVWRLVQRTGAPAADALEACAAGLRADADVRAAVRTAVAGAEVSARMVSLLPLAGLALGALLGAPPWQALLTSPVGRACAVAGTALLLLGRWWSARFVRAALRAGRG
ncbi:MAG: hypothetical protein ACRYF3_06235 [Janthinobacterium lividum]